MKTNREQFLAIFELPSDCSLSLHDISKLSRVPLAALQEVYNRGVGAWKTNPSSVRLKGSFQKNPNLQKFPRTARLGREQWAYGRVFSFVMGTDTSFAKADRDIAREYGLIE
jgi:hypothetical protein